jgi:hypothetical protein
MSLLSYPVVQRTNSKRSIDTLNAMKKPRFSIAINSERYGALERSLRRVNIPSFSMDATSSNNRGGEARFWGDTIKFEQFNADFILDEEMQNYMEAIDWMTTPVDNPDNDGGIPEDVAIMLYTSHNNPIRTIRLFNCFPTAVSGVDFDMADKGSEAITFNVTFSFDYFRIE